MISELFEFFFAEFRKADQWYYHLVALFLVSLAAWLFWRLWSFTILPLLRPYEPRELPYWIPFLGHAVSFFNDADGTFSRARTYFGNVREPFAITVAGTRLYVITSATDITSVYRNIEQLTFDEYITDMMVAFGASSSGISKMWQPPESTKKSPYRGKTLAHVAETLIRQQLQTGEHLDQLQSVLLENVRKAMTWENMSPKAVLSSTWTVRKVSLLDWTREALLAGATTAFFGDSLLAIQPKLFESFFSFDDKSWKLTYKIPRPWSNDMLAAKNTAQDALTTYFEMPKEARTGQCWLVDTLEDEMKAVGIGPKDIAAYLMMIYWVINANAWKVSFWMLAYLVHNPDLLHTVRAEIDPIITACQTPNDLASSLSASPNILSLYYETLRLVTSSVSVRNIATPALVGTKRLLPGGRVIIPYRQLLFNDSVFGSDAEDFNPKRFLSDENLKNSPSFRPFGGGTTYCPGRFLAKAEVLTCVALAIGRYDMELDGGKVEGKGGATFPRLEIKKPCLGIMGPVEGDDVVVNIRCKTY